MKSETTQPYLIEQLDNGLRLVMQPSRANHVVGMRVTLPYPAATETVENAGLYGFALRMLCRGTTSRTALVFHEAMEDIGAELSTGSGDLQCALTLKCTDDGLDDALTLMQDIVQNATFTDEEIERERRTTLAALRQQDDSTMGYTIRHLNRLMFPNSGVGLSRSGLLESVPTFTRDTLIQSANTVLQTASPYAVAIGNFDTTRLSDKLGQLFGANKPTMAPPQLLVPDMPAASTSVTLTRDCNQAVVTLGWRVCDRLHPQFPALRLCSAVLGESMSSRFFLHLRDEQGLAYATGCRISADQSSGTVMGYIGTTPETRELARNGMLAQIELIKNELVTPEELERTRNYVIGSLLINAQANLSRAGRLAGYMGLGLGLDGEKQYLEQLKAVTPEEIRQAAQDFLTTPIQAELIPTDK